MENNSGLDDTNFTSGIFSFIYKSNFKYLFQHEDASVKMFDYLLATNNLKCEFEKYGLKEQDLTFIKEMIRDPSDNGSEWNYKGRPKEKAFLYQVCAGNINHTCAYKNR